MLKIRTLEFHAKDGVLVQQFEGIIHRGTHMDAPIHVAENTPTITGYALWRFFGTAPARRNPISTTSTRPSPVARSSRTFRTGSRPTRSSRVTGSPESKTSAGT